MTIYRHPKTPNYSKSTRIIRKFESHEFAQPAVVNWLGWVAWLAGWMAGLAGLVGWHVPTMWWLSLSSFTCSLLSRFSWFWPPSFSYRSFPPPRIQKIWRAAPEARRKTACEKKHATTDGLTTYVFSIENDNFQKCAAPTGACMIT